ncbi:MULTISPECIES: hypothetical protein [Paenibacillus]|jgi:hypothetical protein|uniref:Uncharacterized protein n=1 Tax=Paenibacillus agaridevorans TaxID=171404 RepID=A0A2R5EUJ3_9BACL|nr:MULTISPECIES: hypothetical protein [Paenibacillus]QNK56331.1 hypothetical protein H7F31_27895 [Paenibacillus sp. PAMC21692]GBG09815.1 hypothetical protein PAT3040_04485 [Paenibacillus agaridevorans]
MFTLKEKIYLLKLLQTQKRKSWLGIGRKDPVHDRLVEKLEQMVRNEQVNKEHL